MAAGRRFAVSALLFLIALGTSQAALAQNAVNTVVITPPTGMDDSGAGNNTATDDDPIVLAAPQLTLTKTHSAAFLVGTNGVYTLTLSNTSSGPTAAPTAGTITVEDTLPTGLSYVSATGTGWTCAPAGQVVTCNTTAVIASQTSAPVITLTVAVAAAAAPNVTNTARASGGGDPTCPASGATQPRCNPSDPTPVSSVPVINFCTANTVYNVTQSTPPPGATRVGNFYRFDLSGTDTLVPALDLPVAPATTNFNALMIDPVRNRLLVISYAGGDAQLWAYDPANGGWYQAAPPMTSVDLPRAGMTPSGIGYLMAGNDATPEVWSVTASGAFDYTITPLGELSFDFPPSGTGIGSGDMAFDAASNGWMSVGQDIYKIDFSTLDAVRQQRPLLNGSPSTIGWAGVAFGNDDRLYLATNGTANAYYALDFRTGAITQVGQSAVSQARDLASCAFPAAPQPAELRVTKTLGLVNGAPYVAGAAVKPNDLLTYHIEIAHAGGDLAATLFPGDIVDSPLPANTTYVAAGNDFTCAGASCSNTNTVNIAAGTSETLDFVTRVDDPLPANLASISNAVAVKGVDCAAAGNTCVATTPIAPVVTVTKTSNPTSGDTVTPGDTINYTLTVTVANSATTGAVTLTDTLSAGQTPGAMPSGCSVAAQVVTCVLNTGAAVGNHTFVYPATVNAGATGSVGNSVVPSGTDNPTCAVGACATTHPIVSPTVTVSKASNPVSGSTVNPGDTIQYTLTVNVANSSTTDDVTLTDTLSAGQTLGALPTGCTAASQVVTCVLAGGALPSGSPYSFTYSATVNADATGSIGNVVLPSGPDNPTCVAGACATTHTIVSPTITVSKASNPVSGSTVNPGDTVQYTLTVNVANSSTTGDVTLTDTLSAGQTLGAMPTGCTAASQVVTCVLAGGALPSGSPYTFTYSATVNANATGSISNAVVPSGPDNPTCIAGGCATTHTLVAPGVTVFKSSNPASGTVVDPGDTIQYTLTVNVVNSATTGAVTLTDTLSSGQTLGVMPAGCTAAGQVVTCVLAGGALPSGSPYTFAYNATVNANATGSIGNVVVPSGPDNPTCAVGGCTTTHTIVAPAVTVSKASNPASGTTVNPGDAIQYTLTVNVANSATIGVVTLTDTLSAGQTLGTLPAGCTPAGQVVTCTLAANSLPGNYIFTYPVTVDADAVGSIGNNVVPSGPDNPTCAPAGCTTTHSIVATAVVVSKSSNPASGTTVSPGDTIQYTLTVDVTQSATTAAVTLTDTLSAGQTLGTLPAGCAASGRVVTCTLAPGALPSGSPYTFVYSATVDASATGSINNSVVPSGPDNPVCSSSGCATTHQIVPTVVTVAKSSNPASGTTVDPGDTIGYTLTVNVANSATTGAVTLTDTLSAGQTLGTLPAGCSAAVRVVTCVLGAGALPGSHTFAYAVTVDSNATGSIGNNVVPSGTDNPTCAAGGCTTTHTIIATAVTVAKSSNPASGSTVAPGDTIQYTLTATVANSATTAPVVLTDTLSAGQTFGTLPAGCTAAGQVATCTLAAGSLPGNHTFVYPVTVDANATGSVGNNVVPSGPDNPTCTAGGCTTTHTIIEPRVTVAKSSNPASGTTVNAGDVITYTVTATVANSATLTPVVLADTLSGAHSLTGTPSVPAGGACTATASGLQCTLAAGSLPGNYAFVYQTVVAATASGAVGNNVAATGGGPTAPECTSCSTNHPIATPVVDASKSSAPGNGSTVNIGDTIQYTLTVTVANAAVTQPVVLTDTPGVGLTIGALPAGCASNGGNIVCTLPTGTVPGSYSFAYPATVNANANGNVANAVVASGGSVGGQPGCLTCATAHPVVDAAQLRIVKQASPRDVKIGDLVRYTLTIENVGAANVTDFTLIDTPPAGFSYVAGSLAVADADGAGSLAGTYPIRVERLDVLVGQQAKVQYLLRVGAGVRPGTHVNRAHAEDGGNIVSNEATAEVQLVADPLLDESLLIGTVFDDRDGDEWQDRAGLEEVRVQGGFAPSAYVAGSTTLDRGQGPVPQADASAPLLHGLDIGAIAGRQSDADPVEAHTVVIGQTLNALVFSDDFVLTSKQGVTVRMDAAGNTRTERSGAAAKGLTAADPTVERRVSQIDGGYRVEYVIGNAGVDEHGIPGVRIASVEGLLIETDQFGRYHLEGVAGGPWERGRNFILKADPATLPPGSVFTDENPLVRRLTPGIPVRFDFPVKLPSGLVEGGKQRVEMELAQVMFDAGSAQLRSEFAPVIDKIVEQVLQHGGGQVVISANGESQALAFDRAQAVRAALLDKLTPEQAKEVDVVLRADIGDADSTLLSLGESAVLGTFLFDTDKATVKPEYSALIAKLAAHIQSQNGGAIAVVGHADRRGSDSYNAALGLRRAKAVFDAIAASLSPEARAKLRVDINENPAAPAGKRGR
ncbi:OmpA family protein [Pseudoxanthomonas sacheonensis]|uniref:Repeat protein (TIGR01451 family)/fimbrial isopeptide formation D2 family protein n=1 Tax=Pseudoxanthomonas sacheonensis TaxID=443615 RepID=A0ABU1RTS6_9GAMM|nr:OmpA family protein [Pseudoxanthomonas sacheonensis]MDR6842173.1 putative repeat protein (TIGR01451 family)/fimbrial isopeptide formation D2 family protein [Pseudoxanthomonas sacheonensis]